MDNRENRIKDESISYWELLPTDLFYRIVVELNPEQIFQMMRVSKKIKTQLSNENSKGLWIEKFKQHFPDQLDEAIASKKPWHEKFRSAYKRTYNTDSSELIFSLMKEGDCERFEKALEHYEYYSSDFSFKIKMLLNKSLVTGKPFYKWKLKQPVLDVLYKKLQEDLNENPENNRLRLFWAIVLKQDKEYISKLSKDIHHNDIIFKRDVYHYYASEPETTLYTPFSLAIELGLTELVAKMNAKTPDVLIQHPNSEMTFEPKTHYTTPMEFAIYHGQFESVKTIIGDPAEIAKVELALKHAFTYENIYIFEMLIKEYKSIITERVIIENLSAAISCVNIPFFNLLFNQYADIAIKSDHLLATALNGNNHEKIENIDEQIENMARHKMAEILIEKGCPIPKCAVQHALTTGTGFFTIYKLILEKKPDAINELNDKGESALIAMTRTGNEQAVRLLIAYKADLELPVQISPDHSYPRTALSIAIENGFDEIAYQLIRAGAKIDLTFGNQEESILHLAIKNKMFNTIKVLLSNHPDLMMKADKNNQTPLDFLLLELEPNLTDDHQITEIKNIYLQKFIEYTNRKETLDKQSEYKNPKKSEPSELVFKIIKASNNAPDLKDEKSNTFLMYELQKANPDQEILKLLVKANLNYNYMNKNGKSPLYYAAEKKQNEVVYLLLAKGAQVNLDKLPPQDNLNPSIRVLLNLQAYLQNREDEEEYNFSLNIFATKEEKFSKDQKIEAAVILKEYLLHTSIFKNILLPKSYEYKKARLEAQLSKNKNILLQGRLGNIVKKSESPFLKSLSNSDKETTKAESTLSKQVGF